MGKFHMKTCNMFQGNRLHFLKTQHHGPGTALCHLLQVNFTIVLFTKNTVWSEHPAAPHRALLLSASVPSGSVLNWAITWTHRVTVGGSSLRQDTRVLAIVCTELGCEEKSKMGVEGHKPDWNKNYNLWIMWTNIRTAAQLLTNQRQSGCSHHAVSILDLLCFWLK